MKAIRRTISVILVLTILCCISMVAFAAFGSGSKVTDHYGTLSGSARQSGNNLTTTTKVTENDHGGFLITHLDITDGDDLTLSRHEYWSKAGALSLTNTTYLIGVTRAVNYPKYAAYAAEVRGGSEVGDCVYINCIIDTDVLS